MNCWVAICKETLVEKISELSTSIPYKIVFEFDKILKLR